MNRSTNIRGYLHTHLWDTLLICLCGILLVSHTLYVVQTHQYPQGGLDEPVYLEGALTIYDLLRANPIQSWHKVLSVLVDRQPFYPILIALPLFIFGTDHLYKIALWMNIIYYIITIVAVYGLGRRYLSKRSSFLASYIFAFYGFPLFYLHFTYSETAVTAFITSAVAYLAWTNGLTKIKSVIGFSLFFAISSLVRWVAPFFIIGPLIAEICVGLLKNRKNFQAHVGHLFKGLGIVFIIGIIPAVSLHYWPQREYLLGYVLSNTSNSVRWSSQFLGMSISDGVVSVRSVMFYLNILSQQGIYFWLLFCLGFFVSLRYFKKYIFLIMAFVIPYAVFTFSTTWKGDRFILPIYPFMALLSTTIFDHMRHIWLRRTLIILTVAIGFLNFIGASWGLGPLGQQGLKDIVLPEFIHHPRRIYLTTMVWPPRPNEANIDRIVETLIADWGKSHRPFVFSSFFYMPQIEQGIGEVFFRERRGLGRQLYLYNVANNDENIFFSNVMQSDYILVKDGVVDGKHKADDQPVPDDYVYYIHKFKTAFKKSGSELPPGYSIVGKIFIPFDQSTLTIFKKNSNVRIEDWKMFMALNSQ